MKLIPQASGVIFSSSVIAHMTRLFIISATATNFQHSNSSTFPPLMIGRIFHRPYHLLNQLP